MGLVDAAVAIPCEQPQQERERRHEQHRGEAVLGQERDREAQRRQAPVDRPHGQHHPRLHRDVGHDAGQAHAQQCAHEVEEAAGGERAGHQRHGVKVDRGRAGEHEHKRGPQRVPGVGHGGHEAARGDAPQRPVDRRGGHQPDGHRARHDGRRQQHQHGDEHQLGGQHVPGAHGELDPGHEDVQHHEQTDHRRLQRACRARRDEQAGRSGDEQRAGRGFDDQLTAGGARAGARLPAVLEQLLGRRLILAGGRVTVAHGPAMPVSECSGAG